MAGKTDEIVSLDEMCENSNNCNPTRCLRCNHADMLHVERGGCYVRCGCKTGKHLETWSIGYPFVLSPEECADFSEVTDERRKLMVNYAWVISCERKMEHFRRPGTKPVCIGALPSHYNSRIPFPEIETKIG